MNIFSDNEGLNAKSEKTRVSFVTSQLFGAAQQYRQKYDLRWYIYNSYYDGNSWVMWSKTNARIENVYLEDWRSKFAVPDVFVSHRSTKALILNKNPVYDVVPQKNDNDWDINGGQMDPATGQPVGSFKEGPMVRAAKVAGKILEHLEHKLCLADKRDEVVDDALRLGNGYWKFGYDQEAYDGEGDVSVTRVSPYSVYVDPNCTDLTTFENCRYIIYVVPRDTKYIELKYGKKVEADNKDSSSSYESLYRQQKAYIADKSNSTNSTVLVYECWVREPYTEEIPDTDGEKMVKYRMRCITCTQSVLLRDVNDPLKGSDGKPFNEFPFESYQVNCMPGDIYADGIIKQQKDLIDQANRRLSQIADNASRMTNPRIMAPRGSIIPEEFSDIPGEIVEYTVLGQQGMKPEIMQGVSVASDAMMLVEFSTKRAQDAAGIHDVSRGILPPGVSSGRQLELAQAADTMVLGPCIRDLEDFLKRSAKKILKIVKNKYPSEREVVIKGKRGSLENLHIIPDDINFSDVNVEISSFLANTKAGRQDILLELKRDGILDPETALEFYEFPDIDSIVERLHKHKDLMGAKPQPQGQPQQPPMPVPPMAR